VLSKRDSAPASGLPCRVVKAGKPHFTRAAKEKRTADDIVFDSACDMKFHLRLREERLTLPAMWWLYRPCFRLLGVKHNSDFIVIRPMNLNEHPGACMVDVYEIKPRLREPFRSQALTKWKRNAAQVRSAYGVEIQLVEI